MKNIIRYFAWTLVLPFLFSCQPEAITHPDQSKIPSASDLKVVSAIDSMNRVTFAISNTGCVPIWIYDGSIVGTGNGFTMQFVNAGDYTMEVKAMNQNGQSDGSISYTFNVPTTYVPPYDPAADLKLLTGGSTKQWHIDGTIVGHMGCGPSVAESASWWGAAVNDKKDWSVYDNVVTFGSDYSYTLDPVDGKIYVNKDCTYQPASNPNDGNDYNATCEKVSTTFTLKKGTDDNAYLYLTLPANTIFSYLPNDDFLKNPQFIVKEISAGKLVLATWNGGIAWQFILTPVDPNAGLSDTDKLTGGSSRSWMMDYATAGHLGCGPDATNPGGWWSAQPFEKINWGLYDDVLTFNSDGSYTFDPGVGGKVYVNKGCTFEPSNNPKDDNDYNVAISKQTSTFTLNGDKLTFPANTHIGYMSSDAQFANPTFTVTIITNDVLELVYNGNGIAWHWRFVRVGYAGDAVAEGDYAKSLALGKWTWDPSIQGHMGCGPTGGDGLGWWSAAPNDKKDWHLYDDVLTFGSDGKYTFDPVDGQTYVNKDSGFQSEKYLNDNNDYCVTVDKQTVDYKFAKEADGKWYVTLPANTLFSYLPNAAALTNPHYYVFSMTPYFADFIIDDGANIAWRYHFKRVIE